MRLHRDPWFAASPRSLRKGFAFPSTRNSSCGSAAQAQPQDVRRADGKPEAFREDSGKAADRLPQLVPPVRYLSLVIGFRRSQHRETDEHREKLSLERCLQSRPQLLNRKIAGCENHNSIRLGFPRRVDRLEKFFRLEISNGQI